MTGPRESRSVLTGLADVRMRTVVTPKLIGCLYVTGAGCMALGSFFALLMVWGFSAWMGSGWWWMAPAVIAGGAAGVLAVRIVCEWVLMAFTRGRAVEPPSRREEEPSKQAHPMRNDGRTIPPPLLLPPDRYGQQSRSGWPEDPPQYQQ